MCSSSSSGIRERENKLISLSQPAVTPPRRARARYQPAVSPGYLYLSFTRVYASGGAPALRREMLTHTYRRIFLFLAVVVDYCSLFLSLSFCSPSTLLLRLVARYIYIHLQDFFASSLCRSGHARCVLFYLILCFGLVRREWESKGMKAAGR